MNIRWIASVLLLATLIGVFGCTAGAEAPTEPAIAEAPNFIGGSTASLSDTADTERPQNLFNLAQTGEDGLASFQIVYPKRASQTVRDEAWKLAEDIRAVTGVSLDVVDHFAEKRDFEIVLQTGTDMTREEILAVTDAYYSVLKENDFLIKVHGTRLVLYGRTEQAIKSAMLFLMGTVSYQNAEAGEYGVKAELEFTYQPSEHPPVEVLNATDKNYFEFKLLNSERGGISMTTYVRLSFTGNAGWRLQTKFTEDDTYNDVGAAQRLAYSLGEEDPSVLEEISVEGPVDGIYRLSASDGSAVTLNTGEFRLDFYTPSGKLASSVTNISTNTGGSMICGVLEEDEAIYGTGERFNNANQRGMYIDMFSKDSWSSAAACYMVIPLLCSSRGSGIFVNLYEPMTMDLGKENKDVWKTVTLGCALDVYFYTTEGIADVIRGYSELTGYAGLPEEWTYGMIVCAYGPEFNRKWTAQITPGADGRNEGVYELIANMERYDLPWTGVLAEAWDYRGAGSKWHKDLKELCDYVHSLGKKFIVYMGVAAVRPEMSADAKLATSKVGSFKSSYYLYQQKAFGSGHLLPETGSDGNNPDNAGGDRVYLDITNPDAVEWYFNEYWTYLMNDIGVDGCKIDFCEQLPENYKLLYYDETVPTEGSHHWYPTAFCAMYWDLISSKPDSGMCYTRGGGIGSQRAPYMWAGDQARGYASLEWQLTAVLSSGLSGVPYMSYDMAGYQYGGYSRDIAYESQVFIRGTQFTAYTICMQTHGTVRRAYQFAEQNENFLYVTEIYRAYVKLHEHLTPYITELSETASTTGMPVMRHLVLGWQGDKTAQGIEDEYTFGDAFLIAPILDDGYTRDIYLPEGEWMDLNTGEEYSVDGNGLWLRGYEASLAELPTFYNKNTVSEIAPTLVDGICELYDYARSVAP